MTTDSRAPRTAAGQQMLNSHMHWGEWYEHNWLAAILAIEDEASQQGIGDIVAGAYAKGKAEAAADPVAGEARPWRALIDDYGQEGERGGSMFITDDPDDSQRPIAQGLEWRQAKAIVDAHNAALPTPTPEPHVDYAGRTCTTGLMHNHATPAPKEGEG